MVYISFAVLLLLLWLLLLKSYLIYYYFLSAYSLAWVVKTGNIGTPLPPTPTPLLPLMYVRSSFEFLLL